MISQLINNPSNAVSRFRYDVKKPSWMSRINFLKCFLIGTAPLHPQIFDIDANLRNKGRELLHLLEGGDEEADMSKLKDIDEPMSEEVKSSLAERRISLADVRGAWDDKKKVSKAKDGKGR